MKKLNLPNKLVFITNSVAALMLLLSYILPNLKPSQFALLSVLSLAVPLLIILNVLFVIYWLVSLKKQFVLSLLILLLGYSHVSSLYKFWGAEKNDRDSDLSIMNFNVRLFNLYNWIDRSDVATEIIELIKKEDPDIVSFQEYHPHEDIDLSFYPYKYEALSGFRVQYGQAIFSKYPIINKGSIKFPETANNAIYSDVVLESDTIRIYNVHLQSLKIDERLEDLNKENSERLIRSAGATFRKQQIQTELFNKHKKTSSYKTIICGDFNNTAYSYVYKEIREDLKDAFEESGRGFGKTYDYKYFPVRIDFILADKSFNVESFKTINERLSDHFPIMAGISLR
jgi:endonuclease/exonuclease/phosphatase family metal-dependent hydrolase